MNRWKRVGHGMMENPGQWDTGNGAIDTVEENEKYPGVERVTRESYCGRDYDNRRWYRLARGPEKAYSTPNRALEDALRAAREIIAYAGKGQTDSVIACVEAGVDVNARNEVGNTSLHVAAEKGYTNTVRALLHKGAAVGVRNHSGRTALHYAASNGSVEVANLLLDCGADVDERDADQETPLSVAASNKCIGMVSLLLDRGAMLNIQNKHGLTALHRAGAKGYADIATSLLDYGADPTVENDDGKSAMTAILDRAHRGEEEFLELAERLKSTYPEQFMDWWTKPKPEEA